MLSGPPVLHGGLQARLVHEQLGKQRFRGLGPLQQAQLGEGVTSACTPTSRHTQGRARSMGGQPKLPWPGSLSPQQQDPAARDTRKLLPLASAGWGTARD